MAETSPAQGTLIDTHAHLDFADFETDLEEIISRSQVAGLAAIVSIGIEPADWPRTIGLSQRFEIVHAALGIHPNSADQATDQSLERLAALCSSAEGNKRIV